MPSVIVYLRGFHFLSTLVRLLPALTVGGAIGMERSYQNRPAGIRTRIRSIPDISADERS